ncbi:hypothetical protein EV122DRAFT_284899 [Schizophyllum commune]
MATVTAHITGGLHSGRTHSEWLNALYGPVKRASPTMFTNHLNWWLTDCRPSVCEPRPDLTIQPAPQHILVHQDLVPRNMIVDRRGTLWIVDWGHAGYYPVFMEYAGMDAARGLAMSWLSAPTFLFWTATRGEEKDSVSPRPMHTQLDATFASVTFPPPASNYGVLSSLRRASGLMSDPMTLRT